MDDGRAESTQDPGQPHDVPLAADEPSFDDVEINRRIKAIMTAARQGSSSAVGELFEECRNYLLWIANRRLDQSIQSKVGASDLVQETILQAHQIFDRFHGATRQELLAWLAQILELKCAQTARHHLHTEKRDVTRELPVQILEHKLVADARLPAAPSPDSALRKTEKELRLQAALERLPADYRTVVQLRSLEQRSFAEVGDAMGRSAGAARKLWIRAIESLEAELRSSSDSSG